VETAGAGNVDQYTRYAVCFERYSE